MHIRVLEQVTFQVLEGVTDETFLEAVEQSNLFLRGRTGFLKRQVCKQSNSNVWLDLVSWESMETALVAATEFTHQLSRRISID